MKIGSMFSGVGGLDLAVEAVFNAETAWHCEWEDAPSKILATHWPGIPNYRDVTQVDWQNVPPVDIITGGFPCQDVSLVGRRAGMTEGTRSNLWGAMRTAIEAIQPRYVVAENVRGLLSAKAYSDSDMEPGEGSLGDDGPPNLRAIGRVVSDLDELGYDTQWRGLRAADVGAPHGRFRVFILAERRDAIGDPPCVGMEGHRAGGLKVPHAPFRPELSRRPGGTTPSEPTASNAGRVRRGSRRESAPRQATGGRALSGPAGRGGARTGWGPYSPAIRRWEQLRGPAPAPTELTAKGKHRLSAVFVEWLMGLPAGWVTDIGISRNEQLKALGNGVVPAQAAAALDHMLATNLTESGAAA